MDFLLPDGAADALAMPDLGRLLNGATGAFVAFTLIVTRLSGMLVIGPVFGHPNIPVQVRVFLVLAISLVITPTLLGSDQQRTFRLLDRNADGLLTQDELPGSLHPQFARLIENAEKQEGDGLTVDEFHLTLPLPASLFEYAWLALVEFAMGIGLGLGVLTIVSGLQMAGGLIDQQIGTSLGSVFNPEFETDASLSGQMLYQLGLVVFLVLGGHYLIVSALVDTFQTLPVGYAWISPPAVELLSDLVRQSLVLAVQISAPVMGTMAVIGLAMGFLGHTIPQINVLVVGFPIRTLGGLAIMGLATPAIVEALARVLPGGIEQLRLALMGR
ncbi:MAG TPA: flagellar biosynthetic protein FliR [Planctomycetaceae bacterium]|nr:flagellar biosynthetic protein FliR [Planctomycetaceae bacterium]